MKHKYDLIVGFGNACSCSQILRKAGLQLLSFPFDWVIYEVDDDLRRRADTVANDFAGWLEEKDLVFRGNADWYDKDIYINTATKCLFNHEIPKGTKLNVAFPAVREKYDRRVRRMFELMRNSARVLIVRIDRPDQKIPTPVGECSYLLEKLTTKFPNTVFDLLLLNYEIGLSPESRRIDAPAPHVTRVAFDYKDPDPSSASYAPNIPLVAKMLADRCEVADYRTDDEKLRHAPGRRISHHLRYDFIFPLGSAFSCSQCLRAGGLQLLSLPYDWTVTPLPHGLTIRAEHIANDFHEWFRKEDLQLETTICTPKNGPKSCGHTLIHCRNIRTRHDFPHDFYADDSLENAYPAVAEKYRRRIRRLFDRIRHSKRVLVVRIDTPIQNEPTSLDDCNKAIMTLEQKFPGVHFDMLLMHYRKGVSFEERQESSYEAHIDFASWDYRDYTPGKPDYAVLTRQIGDWLKTHYAVRDYRTHSEKSAKRRKDLQAKYRAHGAENYWQYRLVRLRRRISSFLNRLGIGSTAQT